MSTDSGMRLPDGTPYTAIGFQEYPEAEVMQTGQLLQWLMDGKTLKDPPYGWSPFGTHAGEEGYLEFSGSVGEDGMPLWERPVDEPSSRGWHAA